MQRYDRERQTAHRHPGTGAVEDFTTPFLISAGFVCFIALYVVWSLMGYPIAIACALLSERVLRRDG